MMVIRYARRRNRANKTGRLGMDRGHIAGVSCSGATGYCR